MRNVKVVIGANFGDEGKGKVTNMYARNWADIVVRFNGGAQAAHTVMKRDGFRHVFGHLGSAAMDGVPTYLSEYFVCNPKLFLRELDELSFRNDGATISPVYVDQRCIVTTPFDVFVNQQLENKRAGKRHGSCGVGFHETIERCYNDYNFNIKFIINNDEEAVKERLKEIRDKYTIPRLRDLDLTVPNDLKHVFEDFYIDDIYKEICMFMSSIIVVYDSSFLHRFNNIVFEGAQGLLLDEDHEWFPYVTHSKTGIHNVLRILWDARIYVDNTNMEVTYVTRPYMTRHGAGPFPTERKDISDFNIEDATNKPNPFQGSLRLGLFDVALFIKTVKNDLIEMPESCKIKIHITCFDQIPKHGLRIVLPNNVEYIIPEEYTRLLFMNLVKDVTTDIEYSSSPYSI